MHYYTRDRKRLIPAKKMQVQAVFVTCVSRGVRFTPRHFMTLVCAHSRTAYSCHINRYSLPSWLTPLHFNLHHLVKHTHFTLYEAILVIILATLLQKLAYSGIYQYCRSALVSQRIRTRHFWPCADLDPAVKVNADSDLVPDPDPGIWWQEIVKFYNWKQSFYIKKS
jgi:hypothetical protein